MLFTGENLCSFWQKHPSMVHHAKAMLATEPKQTRDKSHTEEQTKWILMETKTLLLNKGKGK